MKMVVQEKKKDFIQSRLVLYFTFFCLKNMVLFVFERGKACLLVWEVFFNQEFVSTIYAEAYDPKENINDVGGEKLMKSQEICMSMIALLIF